MNNSKDFTVTTVTGKQVPRNKCRFIKREYYEINVDCFLMPDNKWHRLNNGQIAFDHEFQKYVLIESCNLSEGIVGIKENGEFLYGMFSPNPSKNTRLNEIPCISYELAESLGAKERVSSGTFYTEDKIKNVSEFNKKKIGFKYSFNLDYSAGPKIPMFSKAYNELYKKKDKYALKPAFTSELKDISWGAEIETQNGAIPERHLLSNGLIPLKDGSLRHHDIEPYEYTTIPLSGEKGLFTMMDIMSLIEKYTVIGDKCALHLHIGGYKPSKEFVVALHRVLIKVQDEIYSMFPAGYKYTSDNGFKQKDYCAPISDLKLLKRNSVDENFNIIYNYYSGGYGSFEGFGVRNHPKDEGNRQKWQINERYKVLNIIPLVWGGSGTLEWRVHPPTQNVHKILNWLYISNAVIAYAYKNAKEFAEFGQLTNLDLEKILYSVYSEKLAKVLVGYVEWRKEYMLTMDSTGQKELEEDLSLKIPFSVLL